jgi:pimeloyl-ACP methyl ester carboxylesterase
MQVVFLHGLETGPHGSKYRALQSLVPDVLAPDCEGIWDIEARLSIIRSALEGQSGLLLVGSSFGGLAAALFASRFADRVLGCVLCAPAVHHPHGAEIAQVPADTVIIHGRQDDIVPLQAVEAFAQRFPWVRLLIVEDDHRLGSSYDVLLAEVKAMIDRLG